MGDLVSASGSWEAIYFDCSGFQSAPQAAWNFATRPPVKKYPRSDSARRKSNVFPVRQCHVPPMAAIRQNIATGAAPDDSGVILRLNDDGSVPLNNPFAALGGNLAKYYAYGMRNSFRMAFDPAGKLWLTRMVRTYTPR